MKDRLVIGGALVGILGYNDDWRNNYLRLITKIFGEHNIILKPKGYPQFIGFKTGDHSD